MFTFYFCSKLKTDDKQQQNINGWMKFFSGKTKQHNKIGPQNLINQFSKTTDQRINLLIHQSNKQ